MTGAEEEIRFPSFAIAILCVGLLAHCMVFTAPLPYVAFMMVDFKMAENVDEAGYTAGWITGMFMVGRLLSGIPWGIASDRFGRKICMFISLVDLCVLGLAFGFSINFYMAAFIRFSIGIGNGFMGIAKTYISEITQTKEHEVRAFSYFNGVYGMGMIVGPIIGGLAARPALQYPDFFAQTGLFGRFPYLLPSILCSLLAFIGAVEVLLFLPESLHLKKNKAKEQTAKYKPLQQQDEENGNDDERTDIETNASSSEKGEAGIADTEANNPATLSTTSASDGSSSFSMLQALSQPPIRALLVTSMCLNCFCIVVDEVYPLWAVTSLSNGGLAWDSIDVGETLAVTGLLLSLYQFFCYEKMISVFFSGKNNKEILMWMILLIALTIPFIPILTDVALDLSLKYFPDISTRNNLFMKFIVVLTLAVYNIPGIGAFTYLTILINSSTDSSSTGRLNGLASVAGKFGFLTFLLLFLKTVLSLLFL
jgi:MFS family permease